MVLAGNVNLEGELYLSKNIAYTIETLAIEFNRDINQVKEKINPIDKEDEIDDNGLIYFYDNDEEIPLGIGERAINDVNLTKQ